MKLQRSANNDRALIKVLHQERFVEEVSRKKLCQENVKGLLTKTPYGGHKRSKITIGPMSYRKTPTIWIRLMSKHV